MDWFKKNPFLGGLAAGTAVLAAAAAYFAFSASAEMSARVEEYSSQSSALRGMQDAKPFPNEENAKKAEEEAARARQMLGEVSAAVARQTVPLDPAVTPQLFQDQLSAANEALETKARDGKVALPEDFYLGFEQYRAQPPPAAAAPILGQQLQTIGQVLSILVESRVRSIEGVTRSPLSAEGSGSQGKPQDRDKGITMASFDVEFVADQANLREAMGSIIEAEPIVLVRLLTVSNTQPVGPPKAAEESGAEATPAGTSETEGGVPVLFGQERLKVKLRLASITGVADGGKK